MANPILCIYQDSKGFIWIGTYEGLSRYDGYKFTNYTNANGLSDNQINSIIEVNGKLLIAENNGAVDIIENNSIKKEFTAPSAVNVIQPYQDRLLLTTDKNGFYEYKNDTIISPVQQKIEWPLGHFIPINDSFLLSGGAHDLILYKKDLSVHSIFKSPGTTFNFFMQDSKKRNWACTAGGLQLMQITGGNKPNISFAPLPAEFDFPPLNNANVTSMIEEKDGSIWIGTSKGLVHLFPDGRYHIYSEKDGLPSATIHTLYRDKENNLWIGTGLGLAKWVAANHVLFYNTENEDFKNDVYDIFHLDNNKILLKSLHGLQYFNVATKEIKNLSPGRQPYYHPITGSSPMLLYYDDNKIGIIDSTKNKVVPVRKLDPKIPGAFDVHQHPDGTIFFGLFDGLSASKGTTVKKILPHRVTSMVIDRNGNSWVGTWENGLFRIKINKDVETTYDVQDMSYLVKEKEIRSLYVDSKNNIWVGTRYAGAFCLTERPGGKFDVQHFNRQSGLMSDWVSGFGETNEGDMWIGSFLGLDKLVKESSGYRVFNFSKAVNFFAVVKKIISVGNHEWVCVANTGIAYFKDESLHQSLPLQASILSASLGLHQNKLSIVLPREKILLKPFQNAARFEFSSLGFINERQIMYSYRLIGSSDTSWSKPENIHEASYASLSPGDYTFEVKTIGWNGQHGSPATFSFFISTPFWKQWWFIGLCILAIVIFFYALYRYRIRQLLRLQTVRNNIATDLHDDIGSSLTNISILSELSSKNISYPEKAQPFLQRISEEVQASSQAMDDIIWSVNSHNDSLPETMARMRRYAAELFDNSEIQCHLDLEENAGNKKLSMEQRRDVYLIYKEVLNNIHKHADANNVWINVSQNQNYLLMKIRDDGKGFNTDLVTHRNGLKNLQSRVGKWSGKIQIRSEENKGTTIDIKIPLKD